MQSIDVIQWLLLCFFLIPTIEAVLMAAGVSYAALRFKQNNDKFTKLIIQITTVGKEPELVRKTLSKIRSYALTMNHELWVVIEPGHETSYVQANRVIVVPKEFTCKPIDKARALEYTRLERKKAQLNRKDVKILFVDDDTLPTKRYINMAFRGDYDLCQGFTVANRWFAVGSWKHFILSHLDNIRVRNCLIYCSVTQGIMQKPLFVHGEGLCVTGFTEDIVTWDRPIVASDDLVFGTNAAHMGFSWGFFPAAIQLVSPWSFRENLEQRRRWTWGNFQAIYSREIMPLGLAIFKAFKYVLGAITLIASSTGMVLLAVGIAKVPYQAHVAFWVSLALWVTSYGFAGWLGAGGEPNRERYQKKYGETPTLRRWRKATIHFWLFRITQTIAAAVMTPVTAITPIFVIGYSIIRGRPRRFVVIDKSNQAMQLNQPTPKVVT